MNELRHQIDRQQRQIQQLLGLHAGNGRNPRVSMSPTQTSSYNEQRYSPNRHPSSQY